MEFCYLCGHYSFQTASKIKWDIKYTLISMGILLIWLRPFWCLWATTAFKQPWRSNLTLDLKSVTPFTYVLMSLWPLTASMS